MVYRYSSKVEWLTRGFFASIYGLMVLGGLVTGAWVAALAVGALGAGGGYRWFRARVVTSDEGVAIHNALRTFHVGWDRIDRFEVGTERMGVFSFPWTGIAVLRDGSRVPMHGLAAANVSSEREREALAALIRELNAERRSAEGPVAGPA